MFSRKNKKTLISRGKFIKTNRAKAKLKRIKKLKKTKSENLEVVTDLNAESENILYMWPWID